jgi:hypothetical protein
MSYDKVSLLLPMFGADQGTSFPDLSLANRQITLNNTVTKTDQTAFDEYGSSAYFNGTSANLLSTFSGAIASISGDFTIECWVRLDTATLSGGSNRAIYSFTNTTANAARPMILLTNDTAPKPLFYTTSTLLTASSGFAVNQWHHFATVRNGSTVTLYINGTSVGSMTYSTTIVPDAFRIGNSVGSAGWYSGHMQDFVITMEAKYTANFTPPDRFAGRISGTITDDEGDPAVRKVYAVPRADPLRVFATESASDGSYTVLVPMDVGECSRIVLDDDAAPLYNDLIDRVIPA